LTSPKTWRGAKRKEKRGNMEKAKKRKEKREAKGIIKMVGASFLATG
jgi:hypothetical protein